MNIAFLGLGTMGFPMAANLVKAGYEVYGWNRSPEPMSRLATLGTHKAATPREAASCADVLITMLSDDETTRTVLLNGQVLESLKPGTIHINMATVSIDLAREFEQLHKEYGIYYIAAPVLGRFNVAEEGNLNILVAGNLEAVSTVQPLLDVLGQKTWRLGERPEQANATKLAVNFMLASAIGTMGEATALVQGLGVDKSNFLELVTTTLFSAPAYKGYGQAIADEKFEPAGFKLSLGLKDVRLAMEAGERGNVPLPLASVLRDALIEGLAHGEGELDWAALSLTAARRAGQL